MLTKVSGYAGVWTVSNPHFLSSMHSKNRWKERNLLCGGLKPLLAKLQTVPQTTRLNLHATAFPATNAIDSESDSKLLLLVLQVRVGVIRVLALLMTIVIMLYTDLLELNWSTLYSIQQA